MTLTANRARREPVREALRNALALAEKRVLMDENIIKGFVCLSMARGQVEALESGTSREGDIFDAAVKSSCREYELLKTRTGMTSVPADLDQPDDANRPTSTFAKRPVTGMDDYGQQVEGTSSQSQHLGDLDLLADDSMLFGFDIPTSWLLSGWDENSWA